MAALSCEAAKALGRASLFWWLGGWLGRWPSYSFSSPSFFRASLLCPSGMSFGDILTLTQGGRGSLSWLCPWKASCWECWLCSRPTNLAPLISTKSFPMPNEAGRGRELRKTLGETLSKMGLFPRDVLVRHLESFSAAER